MTLVVVRLLSPADYGLMAIATLLTAFVSLVNELGFRPAIIQRDTVTTDLLRQAFGVVLLANVVCYAGLFLATPLVASFFGEARLLHVVPVLGVQFLLAAPGVVPGAMLTRNLDFKALAIVGFGARLTSGVLTIVLATAGHGVWALVAGALFGAVYRTVGVTVASGITLLPRFSFDGLGGFISFGSTVVMQRVLWFGYSQADTLIVGKMLGKELLGSYSVAMHLASLPMQKLNGLINELTLPIFSRLRSESTPVSYYVSKAVRLLSLFAFPVFWGMSSIAPEAVHAVLGEQWLRTAFPLQILALIMPLRMVNTPISQVLNAVGKPGVLLVNSIFAVVVLVPALFVGSQWGLEGVSLAWLSCYPVVFLVSVFRAAQALEMRTSEVLFAMSRPAMGAIVMYASVVAARSMMSPGFDAPVRLAVLVGVGAFAFAGFMFLVQRGAIDEAIALMKGDNSGETSAG